MITVYLERPDKPKFEIPAGQTTVGRGLSNKLVIDIPKVSRKHAYFENDGKNLEYVPHRVGKEDFMFVVGALAPIWAN